MIMFVGRIEPLKGVDTLMEAFRLMTVRQPTFPDDTCVAIVGGDGGDDPARLSAEEERLRRLREEMGLGNLVIFLGSQAQDTLPNYYSAAEMVVVPSHYESFGMVAMEAMACGTPVVASRVGGLAYTVRDGITGYLVPDDDPGALAERMWKLLHDPSLRDRLGRHGHEWAQRFSWTCVADQIVLLYQDLLAERQPQPAAESWT
jgi:D-inositol-3-phosphate glycosyltransferase